MEEQESKISSLEAELVNLKSENETSIALMKQKVEFHERLEAELN